MTTPKPDSPQSRHVWSRVFRRRCQRRRFQRGRGHEQAEDIGAAEPQSLSWKSHAALAGYVGQPGRQENPKAPIKCKNKACDGAVGLTVSRRPGAQADPIIAKADDDCPARRPMTPAQLRTWLEAAVRFANDAPPTRRLAQGDHRPPVTPDGR